MVENNKLSLKRVEISISKFNEVAIPHHLDLLRQHKANIIKYSRLNDTQRVRSEQLNAKRVTSQLRSILAELDAVRSRIREEDAIEFEKLTRKAREGTLAAIHDYLESTPSSIAKSNSTDHISGSVVSTDSVGMVAHAKDVVFAEEGQEEPLIEGVKQIQINLDDQESILNGWQEVQKEVLGLHETWRLLHQHVTEQKETVGQVERLIEDTEVNVIEGRRNLALAERLGSASLSVVGMCVGACVLGPVGVVVGAKGGAVAAIVGSALGLCGANIINKNRRHEHKD